jgi:hypothetical protein
VIEAAEDGCIGYVWGGRGVEMEDFAHGVRVNFICSACGYCFSSSPAIRNRSVVVGLGHWARRAGRTNASAPT